MIDCPSCRGTGLEHGNKCVLCFGDGFLLTKADDTDHCQCWCHSQVDNGSRDAPCPACDASCLNDTDDDYADKL